MVAAVHYRYVSPVNAASPAETTGPVSRRMAWMENLEMLLAKNCEFGDLEDRLLRSRIILGLRNKNLQERLISENPSYSKTIEICRAQELGKEQFKEISEGAEAARFAVIQAVVMDDILLWGKTKQEHDHNLQLLLTRCREQNLRLNLKKCFFLQREVRYLGHVLSAEGLRVDAQRVQDILEMPTPRNSSQRSLQDLLAATNDDDTLVKLRDYANTTWPLHKQEVPEPLRSYWAYRDEIHAQDGLVFRSNKVIREFRTTTASSLNTWCSQIFSVHGLPRKLCTDNGPPFNSSEFKDFLNTLAVDHITSSPYHPRFNGMTERAVQEAKKLLKKCSFKMHVFQMALLEWRNTPRDDVLQSPVQRLMGRQTRTLLPVPTSHLEPRTIPPDVVQGRLQEIRQRQRTYYNRGSRNLPPVMPGQQVTVYDTNQRTWSPAVFLRPADEHRSTIVKTEDGRELRRTREHLRLVDPQPKASLVPEDVSSTEPPQELRRSTRLRREPCRYPQQETR
ncbi:uncharacterized protein [Dermacentor andersoni]|uniref:uncharacterized protein n=1 Tax=Dermacentor andersoni TaxID=34620 RepID=UPI002416FF05|nr:uncharacterized protein LOC126541947 [Dermacentor andersoni]